jgi:hypothetical protein
MEGPEEFEVALAAVEAQAEATLKMAASVTRELKKAKAAAASGQARDLRRSLEAAEALGDQLAVAASALRAGYDFDEAEYLASGAYTKELLATAGPVGLAMFEEDERILCYPSLVRILPGDLAIEVDKRRDRRLRPTLVIRLLQAAQARGPRFKPEPFLESLATAFDLVVAREARQPDGVARLVEVWDVLTLLPGQAREYTKQEFARDLYLLDQSGRTEAKDGRRLEFLASTGTKGSGVLTTVARNGQPQRYWGISFMSVNR